MASWLCYCHGDYWFSYDQSLCYIDTPRHHITKTTEPKSRQSSPEIHGRFEAGNKKWSIAKEQK